MKLVAVMALAVVATPAFAQYGSYRSNPYDSYRAQRYYGGYQHYQPYPYYYRRRSPNPAWDVYDVWGRYKGSDPDPFIRNRLRWERSPVDDP